MLERFTARARRSIVLATKEARSRRHESIGPEHLLVGILRDGDGMAVNVLERASGITRDAALEVEQVLNEAPRSSTDSDLVFSPGLVSVWVVPTNEELMIARHTLACTRL